MTYYPSKPEIERLKQSVREHAEGLVWKIFFGEATSEEKERLDAFNRALHAVANPETPDAVKYELLRRVLQENLAVR